jgi:hypothetical protein
VPHRSGAIRPARCHSSGPPGRVRPDESGGGLSACPHMKALPRRASYERSNGSHKRRVARPRTAAWQMAWGADAEDRGGRADTCTASVASRRRERVGAPGQAWGRTAGGSWRFPARSGGRLPPAWRPDDHRRGGGGARPRTPPEGPLAHPLRQRRAHRRLARLPMWGNVFGASAGENLNVFAGGVAEIRK